MQFFSAKGWIHSVVSCVLVFSLLISPGRVWAGGITVDDNQAKANFPENISFNIAAQANAAIDRVTLIYGVNAESCLNSQARHEMTFDPSKNVELEWEWDLFRSGDLPPGVEIWWQWEIHAVDGTQTVTDRLDLTVVDPDFTWKTLTRGQITLSWAKGSDDFGWSLLNIATTSLERLAKTSNLTPSGKIRLTIYPSANDLKRSLNHTTDWMGGIAFSEYRVVLIAISPDSDTGWPKEVIPHELAHLVFGQRIYNCLTMDAPAWLNEGMAMYAEGPVSEAERKPVLAELKKDNLQSLTSIAHGFPADSHRADLAYAQSKLLVDFMIETYGKDQLEALLDQFKNGEMTNDALRAVYGLDTEGLDQTWRAALGFGKAPEASFATPTAAARATPIPTLALVSPIQALPTAAPTVPAPTAAVEPSATAFEVAQVPPTEAPSSTPATAVPAGQSTVMLPNYVLILLLCGAGLLGMLIAVGVIVLARKKK